MIRFPLFSERDIEVIFRYPYQRRGATADAAMAVLARCFTRTPDALDRYLFPPLGPENPGNSPESCRHLIGIEVECLTQANPADALVIGLGQTLLALGHRDRTILVAYCGSPTLAEQKELRRIAAKISQHPHVRIVLLP